MTSSSSSATTSVQPYLDFGGHCEEALEFYRKALGAEIQMLMRFNESPEPQPELPECFHNKVMHARLRIGGTALMASDGRCEGVTNFEGFHSPSPSPMKRRPSAFLPRWARMGWSR